jgi:hypothetical protein
MNYAEGDAVAIGIDPAGMVPYHNPKQCIASRRTVKRWRGQFRSKPQQPAHLHCLAALRVRRA